MLQFYFLSVFLNAFAGYILFFADDGVSAERGTTFIPHDETLKFALGILSAVTGVLKILSAIEGDLPVIGDIIPAVVNCLCGIVLIFEYYRRRSTIADTEETEKIDFILFRNRRIIGIAALAAAVLHFLFPRVLFL